MIRRFSQLDVFTPVPLKGNPLAVVHDADGLSEAQMAAFARWTNLSETTFLLSPTDPAADYRVRIFTPGGELPFAGHPTLGSAHAWIAAGGLASVDDIAKDAGVNKAMIYYHFTDKLALYRAVVSDGLQWMKGIAAAIAEDNRLPAEKLDAFIAAFVNLTEQRPWMPAIMLREIAEGAPRLDVDTLQHMRGLIVAFSAILAEGQRLGTFRAVHPLLAYESVVGPIIINAARERVAAQPHRQGTDMPMLVSISNADLLAHAQDAARRMLAPSRAETTKDTRQ